MAKAYRYHRFSSKRQDSGSSIERQAELTAGLCGKHGWEIVETLEDKGRSAWKGDHLRVGELGKFKRRVDAGEIDSGSYLVIENLDRLSRQDVKFARRWIEDVTDAGTIVAVCSPEIILDAEALSGSNIIAMLQYLLEAGRSNKESTRKSDMMNKAVERFMDKARKGVVYTSRAPLWLKGEKDGHFEVVEERKAVVEQIYQLAADGMGYHSIAKRLNETVPAWATGWKSGVAIWKYGYIKDILTSPAVEGEYHVRKGEDRTPTGERILVYYPRIIKADLVESARSAILNRRRTGGPTHAQARNLFTGRLRCGHCGDTMVRTVQKNRHEKRYEYLRCIRWINGAKCVNTTQYRYDKFEAAALEQMLHLALDDTHFAKSDETGPLAGRVADIKKQVETRKAEQTRLVKLATMLDDADQIAADLNQIRLDLLKFGAELTEAEDILAHARGQVSAEEHLRRVMEVRDAIHSEDEEIRSAARRKVREAIQSIVQVVQFRRNYLEPDEKRIRRRPDRQIMMTLGGGLMAFMFDNEGGLLQKIDMSSLPDHMLKGLRGTGAGQIINDIKRRRAS